MANPKPQEQPSNQELVASKTFSAFVATGANHPFRHLLNNASKYLTPWATLGDQYKYLHNGILINLFRGTVQTAAQIYAKEQAKLHVGKDSSVGKMAGISAAAAVGTTVATFIETPLIRRTNAKGRKVQLTFFRPGLSLLYAKRETGFATAVLCADEMPPHLRYPTLFFASWATAGFHKFATIYATLDLEPIHTVPSLKKDGIRTILKNIANGHVRDSTHTESNPFYSHPGFKPYFPTPVNFAQKASNVLWVYCGPNVFFYRLVYLAAFGETLIQANKLWPEVKNRFGLFGVASRTPAVARAEENLPRPTPR